MGEGNVWFLKSCLTGPSSVVKMFSTRFCILRWGDQSDVVGTLLGYSSSHWMEFGKSHIEHVQIG